jgi:hypothetical protein
MTKNVFGRTLFMVGFGLSIAASVFIIPPPASHFTACAQGTNSDLCSDILKDGVRDKFLLQNNASVSSALRSWYLSDEFKNYIHNLKGGLKVVLPIGGDLFPLGADASDTDIDQFQSKVRTASDESFNYSNAQYVAQQIANPKIIEAWQECMREHGVARLVFGTLSTNGDAVILKVWYTPASMQDTLPKITHFQAIGVSYTGNSIFSAGEVVPPGGIQQIFQRIGDSPITVTVDTDKGSFLLTLDAKQNDENSQDSSDGQFKEIINSPTWAEAMAKITSLEDKWKAEMGNSLGQTPQQQYIIQMTILTRENRLHAKWQVADLKRKIDLGGPQTERYKKMLIEFNSYPPFNTPVMAPIDPRPPSQR